MSRMRAISTTSRRELSSSFFPPCKARRRRKFAPFWQEQLVSFLVGLRTYDPCSVWEKRPLGRLRRRWVDNIKMDLQEVGCGYMDWIGLAQDRDKWRTLVSAAMNLRVPWNAGNFLTCCKPVSFSRRTLHHGVSKYVENCKNLMQVQK